MSTYQKPWYQVPSHWKVFYSCQHEDIITDEQIHNPTQVRRGAENLYLCAKCQSEISNGKPYLSAKEVQGAEPSVYQRIESARPLFSRPTQHKSVTDAIRSASDNNNRNISVVATVENETPFFLEVSRMLGGSTDELYR